jgi:hypothetical protein
MCHSSHSHSCLLPGSHFCICPVYILFPNCLVIYLPTYGWSILHLCAPPCTSAQFKPPIHRAKLQPMAPFCSTHSSHLHITLASLTFAGIVVVHCA